MNCRKLFRNLDDFVEGRLPKGLKRKMHDHMKICNNCKAEFDRHLNAKNLSNGAFDVPNEKCSIMNVIDKKKYKIRFKIASLIAVLVVLSLLCSIKFFNRTIKPINKIENESSTGISDYVLIKQNVHMADESIYTLYSTDVNTGRQLSKEITISNSLSLNEKLNAIAAGLSQSCFKNLPIKVLRIEQTNGKKIAVIDLEESDVNKKKSDMADYVQPNWAAGYLQGSTGAEITSSSLINSFLQKNIKGTWIDGVQILYNGKTCDFEHAPALKNIIYR